MILSKEFYDLCDPSFQEIIDELEERLAEIEHVRDEWNFEVAMGFNFVLLEFSEKYLIPKEFWTRAADALKFYEDIRPLDRNKINIIAFTLHLHLSDDFGIDLHSGTRDNFLKLLPFQRKKFVYDIENIYDKDERRIIRESDLYYPHSHLEKCFHEFESRLDHAIPDEIFKRYKAMKALYIKIKAVENDQDVNEWFKLVVEAGDAKFLIDNVEYRLGKNLLDKKLWILYLDYLKDAGEFERLLATYSKYCRFFLDDHQMLEEYKKDTVKYGTVKLPWKNLFDFESEKGKGENESDEKMGDYQNGLDSDFYARIQRHLEMKNRFLEHNVNADQNSSDIEMKEVVPFDRSICNAFYDTYKIQNFALPGPLILHILKTANARVLRKLFATCKFFFRHRPTPICYKLGFTSKETIFDNENLSLNVVSDNENSFNVTSNVDAVIKKFYLTGKLDMRENTLWFFQNNATMNIIPRIAKCDAKYIHLEGRGLTFNEVKILIGHGGVIHFEFQDTLTENGNPLQLEKLMEFLPKIEKLILYDINVNQNTAHVLARQCFTGKIYLLDICVINGQPFDRNEFLNYCIANKDDIFSMRLGFNDNFEYVYVDELREIFKSSQLFYFGDEENDENISIFKYM